MRFSQRIGKTPVDDSLQVESIDEALRNRLWEAIVLLADKFPVYGGGEVYWTQLEIQVWCHFFDKAADRVPGNLRSILRKWFFDAKWYEIYDLLEFVAASGSYHSVDRQEFMQLCNGAMERKRGGYQFIEGKIVPRTSPEETASIEQAIEAGQSLSRLKNASTFLKHALEHLSNRKNPNYADSIKQSVAAVESLVQVLTGTQKDLGKALKDLDAQKKIPLHPSLRNSIERLYDFASQEVGVRHAGGPGDPTNTGPEDALFILVTCSALFHYLVAKAQKAGIDLK